MPEALIQQARQPVDEIGSCAQNRKISGRKALHDAGSGTARSSGREDQAPSTIGDNREDCMAIGNFEACIGFTLQFEGGFVNDPDDPGGAINLGVTVGTLSEVLGRPATVAEVKALTS